MASDRVASAWFRVSRHPIAAALILFLFIAGINMLANPGSVGHLFSNSLRWTWGVELVVGSVLALSGLIAGKVAAHRPGMILGTACFAFYAFVAAARLHAPVSALGYTILAAGCLGQAIYADDILGVTGRGRTGE